MRRGRTPTVRISGSGHCKAALTFKWGRGRDERYLTYREARATIIDASAVMAVWSDRLV
jgi:hypothetical protein